MKQGPLHISLILVLCATLHLRAQPPAGTVLWTYDLGAAATSPALWTNGTIYIGTVNGLYAITSGAGSLALGVSRQHGPKPQNH